MSDLKSKFVNRIKLSFRWQLMDLAMNLVLVLTLPPLLQLWGGESVGPHKLVRSLAKS